MTGPGERENHVPPPRSPQHRSRSGRGTWPWVAIAVVLLAGGGLLAASGLTSAKPEANAVRAGAVTSTSPATATSAASAASTGSASALPSSSASTPSPAATTEPRSAGAMGLAAGALAVPDGSQSQLEHWHTGGGGAALTVLSTQVGAATQSAATSRYIEARAACTVLSQDVRTARQAPAIPDSAMQKLYGEALENLSAGAQECVNAISQRPDGDEIVLTHANGTLLGQAMAELDLGATQLFRATAEITALSHS
jgi:hypothetical protein